MSDFEQGIDELEERIEKLKRIEQEMEKLLEAENESKEVNHVKEEIAEKKEYISVLMAEIKRIYEDLNHYNRTVNRDPYCFKNNCENAAISCIELTMLCNQSGFVIGWMEGEPTNDDWDGFFDNQMIILEDKEPERRAKSLYGIRAL